MVIKKGDVFTVSKTDNKFIDILFLYSDGSSWDGCFPIFYPHNSIQFNVAEIDSKLSELYKDMDQTQLSTYAENTKKRWTKSRESETYKVFESLLSGIWECRSCGAGKINDQPAARIRDIKKKGFIIATKNKHCPRCQKKQYHDILLPFEISSETRVEFRKPISLSMRKKIIDVLDNKDVFFDTTRPENEFVIDHKFPSQRWVEEESNNTQLTDLEIKSKFQLLTNQSNMLKSRFCDSCVKTGVRPDFLGIKWFYSGTEKWVSSKNISDGCYGCPWFDLSEWKRKANKKLI